MSDKNTNDEFLRRIEWRKNGQKFDEKIAKVRHQVSALEIEVSWLKSELDDLKRKKLSEGENENV